MKWMNYRLVFFLISTFVVCSGLFSIYKWGLKLGIDFTGGVVVEYKIDKSFSTETATNFLKEKGFSIDSIRTSEGNIYILRLAEIGEDRGSLTNYLKEISGGEVQEIRYENVGPTIGPELIKKTLTAILIASTSILLWVAYQFKSLKFGISAILAVVHDTLVLIGVYSILGHLWGAEIDFLFVTAVLTTLSFSVHDTIVVYDRIREIRKKHGGEIEDIANRAIAETMRRSVNNSLTIIFMLLSLVVLGGSTIQWFAAALLIGTISGTYSSPFVAVPILVTWDLFSKSSFVRNLKKRK
jgi:preprotein translocase subunit SecF